VDYTSSKVKLIQFWRYKTLALIKIIFIFHRLKLNHLSLSLTTVTSRPALLCLE